MIAAAAANVFWGIIPMRRAGDLHLCSRYGEGLALSCREMMDTHLDLKVLTAEEKLTFSKYWSSARFTSQNVE